MQSGGGILGFALIMIVSVFTAGIVFAIVYFAVLRKRNAPKQFTDANIQFTDANIIGTIPRPPEQFIKRCPACKSTYTDETLNFCLSDGAILESFNDAEYETIIRRG